MKDNREHRLDGRDELIPLTRIWKAYRIIYTIFALILLLVFFDAWIIYHNDFIAFTSFGSACFLILYVILTGGNIRSIQDFNENDIITPDCLECIKNKRDIEKEVGYAYWCDKRNRLENNNYILMTLEELREIQKEKYKKEKKVFQFLNSFVLFINIVLIFISFKTGVIPLVIYFLLISIYFICNFGIITAQENSHGSDADCNREENNKNFYRGFAYTLLVVIIIITIIVANQIRLNYFEEFNNFLNIFKFWG